MKTLHLFSGGLDSTVLLYDLLDSRHSVECLLFHYGQRHAKELDFAQATCRKLGIKYSVIELPWHIANLLEDDAAKLRAKAKELISIASKLPESQP